MKRASFRAYMHRHFLLALVPSVVALAVAGCKGPLQTDGPAPRASSVVAADNAGLAPRRSRLPVGSPAPSFVLADQKGTSVSLAEITSRDASVLVFIPPPSDSAARPAFDYARRHRQLLAQRGMEILLVSPANSQSNAALATGESLRVAVLSDPASWVARSFGIVPEEKPTPQAIHTFVIGTDRRIHLSQQGLPDPAQAIMAGESRPGAKRDGVFY